MFAPFFLDLRAARLPVSLREYLMFLEALRAGVADFDIESFYYLARASLVKDERHIDRFDKLFAKHFNGLFETGESAPAGEIPDEWLRKLMEKTLTEEEKALVQTLGGFEALMETLRKRLAEQKERHQGGSKWIGTAGTSPYGAYGYNPEGIRIGQEGSRHRRAVKVWDKREFKNYDDHAELGARAMKVALRRLRRFAREGAAEELDLDGTIGATARNAGHLDLRLRPERKNRVKLLLLLDVGGSMDDHIRAVETLFTAARSEFKHLVSLYFHNCPYETLWADNARGRNGLRPTWDIINTYGPDYKLVFIGDASMSPYEIAMPGGSVEHWNQEPGQAWLQRLLDNWRSAVWINPVPEKYWAYTPSIEMIRRQMDGRMHPLTLAGLDEAMRSLSR